MPNFLDLNASLKYRQDLVEEIDDESKKITPKDDCSSSGNELKLKKTNNFEADESLIISFDDTELQLLSQTYNRD